MQDVEHPATSAHTEVDAGHAHEPTALGLGAEGWVYASITIFILLAIFVAKAPQKIAALLDQRIADTRRQLDEARSLREEAAALLADAKAKQQAATGDAEAILAQARSEADALVKKAEVDSDALIVRRRQMAEDKIAAAERAAVEGVRQAAAEAAAKAARAIITDKITPAKGGALVDTAIKGLGAKLH